MITIDYERYEAYLQRVDSCWVDSITGIQVGFHQQLWTTIPAGGQLGVTEVTGEVTGEIHMDVLRCPMSPISLYIILNTC